MTTKTITGSYPGGYYLNPADQSLRVNPSGYVGGAGVTTTASQPSTIQNLGTVNGSGNGITLSDGGVIINGSTTNSAALIEGPASIVVNGASATIRNYATIQGVALNDGGTVTNFATGKITNGITIAAAAGTVTNNGTIGGPIVEAGFYRYTLYYANPDGSQSGLGVAVGYQKTGYSVQLTAGGTVTNGTPTNTSANILNGVQIAGGSGTVTNNGMIGGVSGSAYISNTLWFTNGYNYYPPNPVYYRRFSASVVGPSVSLLDGGTVTNGTPGNTAAVISNGIIISGAAGHVTNHGTIGGGPGPTLNNIWGFGYYLFPGGKYLFSNTSTYFSVALYAGGSVTNGGSGDTSATITNGIGVSGGTGTIVNYATIEGGVGLAAGGSVTNGSASNTAASISGGVSLSNGGTIVNYATIGGGISLTAGGTVTNGSASDTTATITGTIGGAGGATIHNYGTIDDTGGTAVSLGSSADRLIEEASGTIDGSVTGGTVELPGDAGAGTFSTTVTNATVIVDPGATWSLSGTATFTGVTVQNFGTASGISFGSSSNRLIEEGSGTLSGGAAGGGGTLELAGDAGPGTLAGLGGTITGFASILVDNNAAWTLQNATIAQGTNLSNSGALTMSGLAFNSGQITNLAGATLAFLGDDSITTDPSVKAGGFTNAGLVEKTGGTGTSIIRTGNASLSDTGTIDVETGTLELTGSTVSVAGLVEGAGTIEFGPGTATLGAGTDIETGGWAILGTGAQVTLATSLAYGGGFTESANTVLTLGHSVTLALNGPAAFSHATIEGAGILSTGGATSLASTMLAGTSQWLNTGTVTETAQLTLDSTGHATAFYNETGGIFDIDGNVGIDGTTSGTFANWGLLEKQTGTSGAIAIGLNNNTGMVEVASGALDLQGAVTGTGTLQIDSGKVLQTDASVSAGQKVLFQGTNDKLTLTDAADFHAKLSGFAATDSLDLTEFGAGTTLAYSGNTTMGTLTVTDGALQAKLSLLGQYAAAGFHVATDSHGGSLVTYAPPPTPNLADHLATSTV